MKAVARTARASRSSWVWGSGIHFQARNSHTAAHPSNTMICVPNQTLSFVWAVIFGLPPVCARASRTSGFCFTWVSVSAITLDSELAREWTRIAANLREAFIRVYPRDSRVLQNSCRFQPAPQNFGDAPSLGDAAAGRVRFARVEDFTDRPDPVFVHAFGKPLEKFSGPGFLGRMHFQPGVDERPDQPGPDRSLMIAPIT